jgi:hypothetical protein
VPDVRHRVTAKQACEVVAEATGRPCAPSTLRNWLRQELISAVRVGNGAYRYDPDEIAALVITYPRADVDTRIRELVDNAPEFSTRQLNTIRLLLHATPDRGGEGDAA